MAHSTASATPPAAAHVLITGVTGFVGQAVLERVLAASDARVSLLIRPQGTRSATERLARLLAKPVFAPWRAAVGEAAAEAQILDRVTVLEGDLTDVPELPRDLTTVVHSASSVNFDDPIDKAFTVNVGGPRALYEALLATGSSPHVVHVSTSYVWTGRCAVGLERSVDHDVDWRAELEAALTAGRVAAQDPADLTPALRSAGRRRAHELGWTDAYTMTKALGERVAEELWAGAGHRLTIVRPTIIESAQHLPYPGWIDGFKVADPLIAAYARGELVGFPGRKDVVFDLIPVDHVVGAVVAAAARPLPAGEVRYLQVGSGTTNPMRLDTLRLHMHEYFTEHPWVRRDGEVVHPKAWQFSEPHEIRAWLARRRWILTRVTKALQHGPKALQRRAKPLQQTLAMLDKMDRFIELYAPYSLATTVYDDSATRALLDETTEPRTFDVTEIDWKSYLRDSHLPALVELMRGYTRQRVSTPRPVPTTETAVASTAPALERQGAAALDGVRAVGHRRRGRGARFAPHSGAQTHRATVGGDTSPHL